MSSEVIFEIKERLTYLDTIIDNTYNQINYKKSKAQLIKELPFINMNHDQIPFVNVKQDGSIILTWYFHPISKNQSLIFTTI